MTQECGTGSKDVLEIYVGLYLICNLCTYGTRDITCRIPPVVFFILYRQNCSSVSKAYGRTVMYFVANLIKSWNRNDENWTWTDDWNFKIISHPSNLNVILILGAGGSWYVCNAKLKETSIFALPCLPVSISQLVKRWTDFHEGQC
jgi:hypothetical protein